MRELAQYLLLITGTLYSTVKVAQASTWSNNDTGLAIFVSVS
jgi:hypothetical protein